MTPAPFLPDANINGWFIFKSFDYREISHLHLAGDGTPRGTWSIFTTRAFDEDVKCTICDEIIDLNTIKKLILLTP